MPKLVSARSIEWKDRLKISQSGAYRTNLYNAVVAFRDAPEFAGALAFDEFAMRTVVTRDLPWPRKDRYWTNFDDNFATEWLQSENVNCGREIVQQAIETVASKTIVHPLRDWLSSIKWDGRPRIHDWLTYYVGAARTSYSQAVGKAWLISAVARAFVPGCKADHVLILEGPQGVKKSTALKAIAGDNWFTDELADFGSKDAGLQMAGVWIIELAELDHLSRSESSKIKAFLARSTDRFRPPYGHRLIEAPRQCVFAGSVNRDDYLRDETGNRRFWPVPVGEKIDVEALEDDREQLWAEAVHCFREGEPWWLVDSGIEKEAKEEQKTRRDSDAWEAPIAEWLEKKKLADQFVKNKPEHFTTNEVLKEALGKLPREISQQDASRVSKVLRGWGYTYQKLKVAGHQFKGWKWSSY